LKGKLFKKEESKSAQKQLVSWALQERHEAQTALAEAKKKLKEAREEFKHKHGVYPEQLEKNEY
jgi:hypothetical protein